MRLQDMKIGYRLGLGFTLIVAFMTFIALIGMFSSWQPRKNLTQTIEHTSVKFITISEMRKNLLRQGIFARRIGLSVEFDDMKKNMAAVLAQKKQYDALEKQFIDQNPTPEEKKILAEMQPYKVETTAYQQQAEDFVNNFNGGKAASILATQAAPLQERWLESLDRLVEIQSENIQHNLNDFNQSTNKANEAIIIIGGITVLIAGGLAYYLTRSITNPIQRAMTLSQRVAGGDLEVQIESNSKDETGELLSSLNEMTFRLKEAREILHSIANQDGLTNVANRRFFDKTLLSEWRRLMRRTHNLQGLLEDADGAQEVIDNELSLSLLMIDVDCFKLYNDKFGHQAGDECLKKVAQAIAISLRRTNDLVARYGGEEFVVILPNVPAEGAYRVAERICEAVRSLEIISANPSYGFVSVSIGVATAVSIVPNENPASLIADADAALYQAKRAGRNQAVSATPTLA